MYVFLAGNSFNTEEKVRIRGTKKWTIINNECTIKRGGKYNIIKYIGLVLGTDKYYSTGRGLKL